MKFSKNNFSSRIIAWYQANGRHDLPWQHPKLPYRVWVSEIMLQQTQVKTVLPYFERFMTRFPTLDELAKATLDEVLTLWAGLGYYSRARHLWQTAQVIMSDYLGNFPKDVNLLQQLPGIGRSTAAAIASIAFNQPAAILDANVKRVLCRYFLITTPINTAKTEQRLWALAHELMPKTECALYTQAMMDLGALCCTIKNPNCTACPLQNDCQAFITQATNHTPARVSKKSKPVHTRQFLLLEAAPQQIFLEKRALSGIWGGLWSLLETSSEEDVTAWVQKHFNQIVKKASHWMEYKHQFTHYTLIMQVKWLSLETMAAPAASLIQGQWVYVPEALKLGLPKPIALILQSFHQNTNS